MVEPRRLRLACLACAVPLLAATPAAWADGAGPVGGPRLRGTGTVVAAGAPALPPTVAGGWVVADLDTGRVLAAHAPHARFAPASTLKTLTAHTLIPLLSPAGTVTPTWRDLDVDGSKVGLVPGVRYPVRELFTAMLVVSGNDAANTLAAAAGGVPATVAAMNAEAARLHARDTHAVNANGLDAKGQLTSAYDLALIARAAMQQPDFRRYVAVKRSTITARKGRFAIASHDKLLWNYPGAIGIKNGYTVAAQASFVGAATRGGHTLVVTLMRTTPRYWPEAAALLDWGFAAERAGTPAVGRLVAPGDEPVVAPTAPSAGAAAESASAPSIHPASGRPLAPDLVVGGGLLALAVGLVRRSRRSRRSRRLRLS